MAGLKSILYAIYHQRPVCLILDGDGSHIDRSTSKFCSENNILLYCLPPTHHISHSHLMLVFLPPQASMEKSSHAIQFGKSRITTSKQKVFFKSV